jgi:hypothetical protein
MSSDHMTGLRISSSMLRGSVLAVFLMAMSAALLPNADAGQRLRGEYEVKAAFIYNFLKFIEWPLPSASAEDFRICLTGAVPVSAAFEALDRQYTGGKRLAVHRPDTAAQMRACHVLFIASSEGHRLPAILETLSGANTLTIGDTEGFGRKGVIINFYIMDKKVGFEINADAARRAGLKISAKLMKIAGTVYDSSAPGGGHAPAP